MGRPLENGSWSADAYWTRTVERSLAHWLKFGKLTQRAVTCTHATSMMHRLILTSPAALRLLPMLKASFVSKRSARANTHGAIIITPGDLHISIFRFSGRRSLRV